MKLIFVRHGASVPKEPLHTLLDDFRRPLTKEGRKESRLMSVIARRLFSDIDTIYTSPLVRAAETASYFVRKRHRFEILPELDKLLPAEGLLPFLRKESSAAFFGHEPQLSELFQLMLGPEAEINLEKSGLFVLTGTSAADLRLSGFLNPSLFHRVLKDYGS